MKSLKRLAAASPLHRTILTTGDVARRSGLSVMTVIRACNRGELRCFLLPRTKIRRIHLADALEWVKRWGLPWESSRRKEELHGG